MPSTISNRSSIATTPLREHALQIVEAAYKAIDTTDRINDTISRVGNTLTIQGHSFDLSAYRGISILGFGKASSKAAQALEHILGDSIVGGIVLDKNPVMCSRVHVYQGSHPQPTDHNVVISNKLAELAEGLTEKDLAIVIVSGGGSALLSWPQSECDQGARLYHDFLSAGGTINELNILRKHLSGMKGGGLAKLLYPATVIGLIFCDVPGEEYDIVASGPTYFDETTAEDAQALLHRYNITDQFEFIETPKDASIFEKVINIPVVSNVTALAAMSQKATLLGYGVVSLGAKWYEGPEALISTLVEKAAPRTVVIGGGEPSMIIPSGSGGAGGRNEYCSALMIESIPENSVFISFASDGIDNASVAAGGIIDTLVRERAQLLPLLVSAYLKDHRHDELLNELGVQIITGPTEANVSDLFLLLSQ